MTVCEPTRRQVVDWLLEFSECVRSEDYTRAHPLFSSEVQSFGSRTSVMSGLGELQSRQWELVWPNSRDFRFDIESLVVQGTELFLCASCPFSSTGLHSDGASFERLGRSTVVLNRDSEADGFRAVHTHFSLVPGTADETLLVQPSRRVG